MLGFLEERGEMTGYGLRRALAGSVGHFFGASYGSIYPSLHALRREELVEVREVVQSGRPNRKVYSITPEGSARFRESLEDDPAPDSFRSEFLMHLFFGGHQEPERLLELLESYRATVEEKLAELQRTEEKIPDGPEARFGAMCLRYGLRSHRGTLAWLDEVEGEIRAMAQNEEVRHEQKGRDAR